MSESHAKELAALYARAFAPMGARSWSAADISSLLAEETTRFHSYVPQNASISAFLIARLIGDEAELLTIVVDPASWGQGQAKKLLNTLESDLKTAGATCLFLEVASTNERALRLYEAQGFEKVGVRPKYYSLNSESIDAFVMQKPI